MNENNEPTSELPVSQNPRIETSQVYPVLTHGESPQLDAIPIPPEKNGSFKWFVLRTFRTFLIQLGVVFVIAYILGIVFGNKLTYEVGPYQIFADSYNFLKILMYVSVATIPFGLMGYLVRNFAYVAYPIVAFFVTSALYGSDVVPLIKDLLIGSNAMVVVSYIVAHLLVFPVSLILRGWLRKGEPRLAHQEANAGYIFLLLGALSIVLLVQLSSPLHNALIRSRSLVHVPDNTLSTTLAGNYKTIPYRLEYKEATEQRNGTYRVQDDVRVTPVNEWWNRNTRSSCSGSSGTLYQGSEIKRTPGGVSYLENSSRESYSSTGAKSTMYTVHRTCFVLGYQTYRIERSDRYGDAYLTKYPIENVIDSIANGESFLPGCNDLLNEEFSYCRPSDFVQNTAVFSTAKPPVVSVDVNKPPIQGVKLPEANPEAYLQTAKLSITEWGVSIPLTTEIEDAYYVMSEETGKAATIGLRSLDNDVCFAGKRARSDGGKIIGYGLATVYRTKITELPADPRVTMTGIVIGDYVYAVGTNANFRSCMASVGDRDPILFDDIFDWAATGIKTL